MKNFAILVGNGFTLDYVEPLGFHSSFPLKNFQSNKIRYDSVFMDHLPQIKEHLLGSDLHDFEAIKNYVASFRNLEEEYHILSRSQRHDLLQDKKYTIASKNHIELRRFLAMAYSILQLNIDQSDISGWKWVNWLQENKNDLSFAISFNYDLLLETALCKAGVNFFRVGTNEFYSKVPLIKPHGSIDFDLPNHMISTDNPWNIHATLNDAQMVQVIPKSKWLEPRLEADIISPSLQNIQSHLSWIKKMSGQYSQMAKDLDAIVIVGCSYWDVDRKEIDFFLSQLNRRSKVFLADPYPNKELIKKIQALGLSYRTVKKSGLPW